MKIILSLIFSITAISLGNIPLEEPSNSSFHLEITYSGAPSFYQTKYIINNKGISAYIQRMDIESLEYSTIEKVTVKDFDPTGLYLLLSKTNWDTIPSKLVTPTIDGYYYKVLIELEERTYNFEIDNTYHPVFDSLFTISQELLTIKRKKKRNFLLPYNE